MQRSSPQDQYVHILQPLAWLLNPGALKSTRPVLKHTRYTGIPLSQTRYTHLKAILDLCVGAAGFQQDPLTDRKEGGKALGKTGMAIKQSLAF